MEHISLRSAILVIEPFIVLKGFTSGKNGTKLKIANEFEMVIPSIKVFLAPELNGC